MAGIAYESYYGISGLGSPYLMHHGVKGQKHGVRRWQNEDGSLTPAGRDHYGYGASKRYKNSDGSLTKAGKKRYDRQIKKLSKLKDRTDVDLQKVKADQYEKRASTAKKVAIASGLATAGLVGSTPLRDSVINRQINNHATYENAADAWQGAIRKKNEGLFIDNVDYQTYSKLVDNVGLAATNMDKALDKYYRERGVLEKASATLAAVERMKPVGAAIAGATAAVSTGVYAYNKIQGHLAKKRTTDIGHEKAVADYEAYRKKIEEEYGSVPLSELNKLQHGYYFEKFMSGGE